MAHTQAASPAALSGEQGGTQAGIDAIEQDSARHGVRERAHQEPRQRHRAARRERRRHGDDRVDEHPVADPVAPEHDQPDHGERHARQVQQVLGMPQRDRVADVARELPGRVDDARRALPAQLLRVQAGEPVVAAAVEIGEHEPDACDGAHGPGQGRAPPLWRQRRVGGQADRERNGRRARQTRRQAGREGQDTRRERAPAKAASEASRNSPSE